MNLGKTTTAAVDYSDGLEKQVMAEESEPSEEEVLKLRSKVDTLEDKTEKLLEKVRHHSVSPLSPFSIIQRK